MTFEFKRSTLVYSGLIAGAFATATVFNNCGKFQASTLALESNAAGTSLTGPSVGSDVKTPGAGTTDTGTSAGMIPPNPSPTPTPVPTPTPTPTPTPNINMKALTVTSTAVTVDPYGTASVGLDGGTKPYKLSGDFSADVPEPTVLLIRPFLPGQSKLTVTDAAGASVTVTITVTSELRAAIAFVDPITIGNFVFGNYTYSTDASKTSSHAGIDAKNGMAIYGAPAPPKTHAVFSCENSPGRQFLSKDPGCEGRTVLGTLGYLYDSADALEGYKLSDVSRTYNASANLHRTQTSTEPLPDGFKVEYVLGYLPPRANTAWCGVYVSCLK